MLSCHITSYYKSKQNLCSRWIEETGIVICHHVTKPQSIQFGKKFVDNFLIAVVSSLHV